MINRIQLPGIGETDPAMLKWLGPAIEKEFGTQCEILVARLDPAPSLHPEQLQCFRAEILYWFQKELAAARGDRR